MARRRAVPKPIWMAIVDDENKEFNVVHCSGPRGDLEWSERVADAQERGRKINCSSIEDFQTTREQIIRDFTDRGFDFVESPIV